MDPGNVVIEKIVTLLERVMNANTFYTFRILLTPLQGAEELCRKP